MSNCADCWPAIACKHIGAAQDAVKACPWYKAKPQSGYPVQTMVLTITACDHDGVITKAMTLRLQRTFELEAGGLFESWRSPDAPLPPEIISAVLSALEKCGTKFNDPDIWVDIVELPASMIMAYLGPDYAAKLFPGIPVKQIPAPDPGREPGAQGAGVPPATL
jgi:hypothetical protein